MVPFNTELATNPERRCPCVLLLDTSMSMRGELIAKLNAAMADFKQDLMDDPIAQLRLDLAVVTFGPVRTVIDFHSAGQFVPPYLEAANDTPMGEAICHALDMVEQRKRDYCAHHLSYCRPWVLMITDCAPTDRWQHAAHFVHDGDNHLRKAFSFYAVGVAGARMDLLQQICSPDRPPLHLDGFKFRELFLWLSASLKAVGNSQPSTKVALPSPRLGRSVTRCDEPHTPVPPGPRISAGTSLSRTARGCES